MGRECCKHERGEKCILVLEGHMKERDNMQDFETDMRIILKWLLKGEDGRAWAEWSD